MAPIVRASDGQPVPSAMTEHHFDKPVPRSARPESTQALIQIQNRRREYLERNPAYVSSREHELADPVLYERLIKRFQSAAERSADVKKQGYGRTLEADLLRGEENLRKLSKREPDASQDDGQLHHSTEAAIDDPWSRKATDKADGIRLWQAYITDRFIRGDDGDFAYEAIDSDEDLDSLAHRDAEDAWFDDEEPAVLDGTIDAPNSPRYGQTGVQDF